VTFTVYGQRLPPNRCEVHPDVAEEWPCVLCQNAALEHAEAMLEDRRFDLLADEHGEDCCDE
jgi:hypothetical protein